MPGRVWDVGLCQAQGQPSREANASGCSEGGVGQEGPADEAGPTPSVCSLTLSLGSGSCPLPPAWLGCVETALAFGGRGGLSRGSPDLRLSPPAAVALEGTALGLLVSLQDCGCSRGPVLAAPLSLESSSARRDDAGLGPGQLPLQGSLGFLAALGRATAALAERLVQLCPDGLRLEPPQRPGVTAIPREGTLPSLLL